MPVYEYLCRQCDQSFEKFLKTYHSVDIKCPFCQSPNVEKRVSAPGHVGIKSEVDHGTTCCGREERCDTPACGAEDRSCRLDR